MCGGPVGTVTANYSFTNKFGWLELYCTKEKLQEVIILRNP